MAEQIKPVSTPLPVVGKTFSPDKVIAIMEQLKGQRGNWERQWQDIADLILPRKNDVIVARSPGQKRNFQILDNTGLTANELLAGALHGLLTNPDSPWFEFTTGDIQLDNDDDVRAWLQHAERKVNHAINNANFQTEVHELYLDLSGFCTGCMMIEEDTETIVRFSTKFIRDYLIDENNQGRVDRIYRNWKWSADKIVAEFGIKAVHKDIREAYNKQDTTKVWEIIHAVYPFQMSDTKHTENKWASHYLVKELKYDLLVEKFDAFPYVVPRWAKAAGEVYGRGPGVNALPEMKVLNKMSEVMLIGAQKVVDPPLQMPDDGFVLPIITRPGGLNFYRPGNGQDIIKPIFNDTRMDFGYQAMEDRRRRVRDAFYVDQLQLQPQGGAPMTATEVQQRTAEKMRLLGPMLGRMQTEFLRPLIERVFTIMLKRRLFDAPPAQLKGKKVDVRYSSFIAKAQRMGEGQNIQQFFQAMAPWIQLDPTIVDNFDGDHITRINSGIYGAPAEVLKNYDDVLAIRKQKADALAAQQKQQQMAQQVQTAAQVTDTAGKMGGLNGGQTGK